MKRFWAEAAFVEEQGQYLITLDRKPVKSASGARLAVPFEPLAAAIATEWAQAHAEFSAMDLPMTQLTALAQENMPGRRGEIEARLIAFGMNDLLCYRSLEPLELQAREAEVWDPWLDWAAEQLGIPLEISWGMKPVVQPPKSRDAFARHLDTLNKYELAGMGVIVPALGSLVLSLAVRAGALTVDAACSAAGLEEIWQEARWGLDAQNAERREKTQATVAAAAQFMALCKA